MYEIIRKILVYIEIVLKSIKYLKSNISGTTRPQKMGEKILILGNGQSIDILKNNKSRFRDYDLLVVNFYPLKADEFWEYKPKYLALLDPVFFTEAKNNHSKYNDIIELISLLKNVDWEMYIVTKVDYALSIENNNIKYIKLSKVESFSADSKLGYFLFKKNWLTVPSQNVILAALNFALIFLYQEIALLGVEQNYLQKLFIDEKNQLYMENEHFYDKEYIKKITTYESEIYAMLKTFTGFRIIANLGKIRKITIINYTVDSYIQNYEKVIID